MNWRRRHFPFNAEQTVSVLGEIGPLAAMFLVNGVYGIAAGCWALIVATVASLTVSLWVLGRPPVMPFIAGGVSIVFGALTLITDDPMWVQIKVTIFNSLVAAALWIGERTGHDFFRFVFGKTFHYTDEGWRKLTRNAALFFLVTAILNEVVRLGFDDVEMLALNHLFTGVDIWILFKIFVVMPATGFYFWWQVRRMQRYRLPDPRHFGGANAVQGKDAAA
ncbi:MAG: septation protein IspZ [Hyphomicrobiaceae bacterium]|nr:septation protein IspZ [Hyphomicrobiaceae bacterium]